MFSFLFSYMYLFLSIYNGGMNFCVFEMYVVILIFMKRKIPISIMYICDIIL